MTKKRRVLDVVVQRMQIAEGFARQLDRLGLERRARPVSALEAYIAQHKNQSRRRELALA